jgi:sigma-B regulation protein RsbU (phosphoserine phosphatase)
MDWKPMVAPDAPPRPPSLWRSAGLSGKAFVLAALLLALSLGLQLGEPLASLFRWAVILTGLWFAWRLAALGSRRLIWRVGNRLVVASLFMTAVPIALLLLLAALATYILAGQTAAYILTTEFDSRIAALRTGLEAALSQSPANREETLNQYAAFWNQQNPGLTIHSGAKQITGGTAVPAPDPNWGAASGIVSRDGGFYGWARVSRDGQSLTASYPITNEYLNELARGLGAVQLANYDRLPGGAPRALRLNSRTPPRAIAPPPSANSLDAELFYWAPTTYAMWDQANVSRDVAFLLASRVSAVLGVLFSKSETGNEVAETLLRVTAGLFLTFFLLALAAGLALSRSLATAVHDLYEGTQRIMEGDFSHRIHVSGQDQIASLSRSFNSMTANLQQLLRVAKEKERMQAELEIAREVQNQMYPRNTPRSDTFSALALCNPARTVSGDFHDFQTLPDGRIGLVMGDVAGKGISAALLMATVQSSFRAQVRQGAVKSPALTVAELNQLVYLNTSPEKYATLFLAFYDETASRLIYTNAGHLPPLLLRGEAVIPLAVNGTVVGAFPRVSYEENEIELQSGDILVCYTDGVTEPENEYGEMFGEERLAALIQKNRHKPDAEILNAVFTAVAQWTGSAERQDDISLLLARKI